MSKYSSSINHAFRLICFINNVIIYGFLVNEIESEIMNL